MRWINAKPKKCKSCKKLFYRGRDVTEFRARKFCSQTCSRNWHTGKNHYNWRRGFCLNEGYKRSYSHSRRYVHRLEIEKFLGRKLLSSEIVHHKDGNKLNNKINNLQILSRSEHAKIHHAK